MATDTINFTKEAFLSPWNLVFLIAALVGALIIGAPAANIWLLFAAAAELLYLGTVPRNERYRRLVRSRKIKEAQKQPADREIFRSLSRDDQKRYVRFRNMEKAIKDNYAKLPYSSHGMLEAHLKKLDDLLDSYLNLLQLEDRYRRFNLRGDETDLVHAIEALKLEMQDDPPRVRSVKQRRLTILNKRLDRYKKAKENLALVEAQLETIEDVTRYVYEQSLTMQNPEEVAFQLDTLIAEVEETQAEMDALDDALGDPAMLTSLDIDESDISLQPEGPEIDLDEIEAELPSEEVQSRDASGTREHS